MVTTSGAGTAYTSRAPEHLSSPPVFSRVHLIFCVVFVLLTIVLPVLLWFMASDCPFGIFKQFLRVNTENELFLFIEKWLIKA